MKKKSVKTKFLANTSLSYDADQHSSPEEYEGESLTIPDQSMSVKEILQRHVRGDSMITQEGHFLDDDDADFDNIIEDYEKMDKIETIEYINSIKGVVNQQRKLIQDMIDHHEKMEEEKKEKELLEEPADSENPPEPKV